MPANVGHQLPGCDLIRKTGDATDQRAKLARDPGPGDDRDDREHGKQ